MGVVAVVLGVGCGKHDKELSLGNWDDPLAEHSFAFLWVEDACDYSGKGGSCSTEKLVEIMSFSSDDPSILEVIPAEDVPIAGWPLVPELALAARRAGRTTVRVSARFDDGSERSTSQEIEVMKPDRVELSHRCETDAVRRDLVFTGAILELQGQLFAGDAKLTGAVADAVEVDSDGAVLDPGPGDETRYQLMLPFRPGPLILTSALDEGLRNVFQIYGADDFDRLSQSEPPRENSDGDVMLRFDMLVNGEKPCMSSVLETETLTPEVCGGTDGSELWRGASNGVVHVRPRAAGSCRLAVRAVGASEMQVVQLALPLPAD